MTFIAKIGKDQAIENYHNTLKPLINTRKDLFSPTEYFSEDLYNRMGSLILSRSFHVEEKQETDLHDLDVDPAQALDERNDMHSAGGGVDIDDDDDVNVRGDNDEDEDEDEDEEDVSLVSMVPWADMLNARHGCDNARLFYEKECLNMCSTKNIQQGEQIVRTENNIFKYSLF